MIWSQRMQHEDPILNVETKGIDLWQATNFLSTILYNIALHKNSSRKPKQHEVKRELTRLQNKLTTTGSID